MGLKGIGTVYENEKNGRMVYVPSIVGKEVMEAFLPKYCPLSLSSVQNTCKKSFSAQTLGDCCLFGWFVNRTSGFHDKPASVLFW